MLEPVRLQLVPMDRRIGTEVGGYRILEPLGSGGTSVVYRAEHVRLGRRAALKLLTPAVGHADFRDRFLRESQLAASLDHPSIVPVYDAGEADDLLYIAMACIDGSDLKTLLAEEGRLPPRRALRIAAQIASALDAAHERGLVHRDVKPANILVGPGDRAFLSDFGVVKELASNGTTRTGSFIGTIEYSAPEQIEGGDVDARTDVYSLACVLYECLAGASPFHRASEVAVLNAHLHAPPPKLTKAVPELPPALEPVLAKALSKSPLDRYPSCGEFVAEARAAVAERRVHRRRLTLSVALLLLSALVGAALALGVRSLVVDDETPAAQPSPPAATPPAPSKAELDELLLQSEDGRTLNDVAYALIGEEEFERALPFARKAVRRAEPGTLTRGFANFNLGLALLKLGRCDESLPPLQRALTLEPPALRRYIRPRITQAKRCARGKASAPGRSPSSAERKALSRAG
jgi:tetratricopeptide (TPR) repeat protein/predicted Ser/Thr protein kinase